MKQLAKVGVFTIMTMALIAFTTTAHDIKVVAKVPIKVVKVKSVPKKVIHKTSKSNKIVKLNFIVTHYTNSIRDCGKTNGISASGLNLLKATRNSRGANNRSEIHYIAVPKGIKFGTKFYIEGYGICVATDRGGAIKYKYINGKRYIKVDMFVPRASYKELMKLGKVYREGYIIK